jgi:hypothetical protein
VDGKRGRYSVKEVARIKREIDILFMRLKDEHQTETLDKYCEIKSLIESKYQELNEYIEKESTL